MPTSLSAPSSSPASVSASTERFDAHWVVALLALGVLWLLSTGARALISPDEGRYATLALHVLQSGDWITPRLNGFLYFEKPPMGYWMGALSFAVFGINDFAARLWPTLAGLGCAAAMGWAAAAWWGRDAAWRATLMTGSATWVWANGHFLNLDTGLSFGLSLAFAGVLVGLAPGARRGRSAWLVAWAGMAIATLSKGPIGVVIPAGAMVVYTAVAWLQGERRELLRLWGGLHWGSGLLLYAAMTLPWFIAVSMRNPGFLEFFFVHEHLMRYATKVHRREGGPLYFVPIVLIGAWPWTAMLGYSVFARLRARLGRGRDDATSGMSAMSGLSQATLAADSMPLPAAGAGAGEGAGALRPGRWVACWCGFIFVFFSLSSSKLPSYVLPMFPAMAFWVAGLTLPGGRRMRVFAALALLPWLLLMFGWFALPSMQRDGTPPAALHQIAVWATVAVLPAALGSALAWRWAGQARVTRAVMAIALGHVLAFSALAHGYGDYSMLKSARDYAPKIDAAVPPQAPVFSLRMHDQTLPFYLRRPVVLVEYVDEFQFGETAEPGRIVPDLAAFEARWRALPQAAAVMAPETHRDLLADGLPMREIFRDARRVVIVKPAP